MADKIDPSLRDAMTSADNCYDNADEAWFDFLSSEAVVYAINHSEPYRNADEYRKRFAPIITRAKRRTKVMSRDIQMMENAAVVAQTLQVSEENIVANIRQTVIWQKEGDKWRIRHLHTALIGTPSPKKLPRKISEITVLNERIATIAAVLGVAQ